MFDYVRHTVELDEETDDVALLDIKKRERITWHGAMIFYTGFLAVLQSLICLPGIFTVIPFFKIASLGGAIDSLSLFAFPASFLCGSRPQLPVSSSLPPLPSRCR